MISYLSGKVKEVQGVSILIVNNGVGYEVIVGGVDVSLSEGDEAVLYIRTFIKDDHMELYGFETRELLMLFTTLLTVSGVGPKMAIQILKNLKPGELISAVQEGRADEFQKISGIGKKVASRLVLELQSKLGEEQTLEKLLNGSDRKELDHALRALGYDSREIPSMTKGISSSLSLEEQIQQALQHHE